MKYLVYDGSFDTFLTAVFEYFTFEDKTEVFIRKDTVMLPALFSEKIQIKYDEEKAKRVFVKLKSIIGQHGIKQLLKALLIESDNVEDTVISVIQHLIKVNRNIFTDFGNIDVLNFHDILKKVGREKHRMLGFVRFMLANDGIYYAVISPDFNVLPLIIPHFKSRYADQKWLIYDEKRKYGFFYDLQHIEKVEMTLKTNHALSTDFSIELDEQDKVIQSLWKNYFKHTTIDSRKNKKLHLQYMPKRYWRYLIEKI